MTTIDPRFSEVPQFTLSSADMSNGAPLGAAQYNQHAGGGNESPQLSWSGFPAETKSFVVTAFDPDAAGPGFWHWAVFNLPASVTSLDAGVGAPGARLPGGAITLQNDAGQRDSSAPGRRVAPARIATNSSCTRSTSPNSTSPPTGRRPSWARPWSRTRSPWPCSRRPRCTGERPPVRAEVFSSLLTDAASTVDP